MGIEVTITCDADGCSASIGPCRGIDSEFLKESGRSRAIRRAEQNGWSLTAGRIRCPDCKYDIDVDPETDRTFDLYVHSHD